MIYGTYNEVASPVKKISTLASGDSSHLAVDDF